MQRGKSVLRGRVLAGQGAPTDSSHRARESRGRWRRPTPHGHANGSSHGNHELASLAKTDVDSGQAASPWRERQQACNSRAEEASPAPAGSVGGGSEGQGLPPVAACDHLGVGGPHANRPQVRTGQEPARAGTYQTRQGQVRIHHRMQAIAAGHCPVVYPSWRSGSARCATCSATRHRRSTGSGTPATSTT